MKPKAASQATRRVYLPLVGTDKTVDLPVPGGSGSLTQALPALRQLSEAVMQESERIRIERGRQVSCRSGCAHCCRHLVPISLVEAKALASAFGRLKPGMQKEVRRQFAFVLAAMSEAGLLAEPGAGARAQLVSDAHGDASVTWQDVNRRYFALGLACPFLQNERCVVYEERPMVCREYRVTSDPELCRTLDERADPVPRPFYGTRALSKAHDAVAGARPAAIPLPLLLEWIDHKAIDLGPDLPGAEALEAVLSAIEWDAEEFEDRL